MQKADVVLGVLRERGRRGLPVDELYRQMFNPDLYLVAYGNVYSNQGALTPGVTLETADGMSIGKIEGLIEAMRAERYRFTAVRRVLIPKKSGGLRPLGVPTWSDKLVGEVMRLLLEAYYEPQFSDHSHGFRPGRGCHTALHEIEATWTGTVWFIEADIHDCFGSIDHDILLGILAERIHDGRFLELVRRMLRSGYLEHWQHHDTFSGTVQGSGCSPVLANIYLDQLDKFVTEQLIPNYTVGTRRGRNPAYTRNEAHMRKAWRHQDREVYRYLVTQRRTLPSQNPDDPGFRRLRYVRYADDELLGFIGPRKEAEQITEELARFLGQQLRLDMSRRKTLITHARTGKARFLGYDIWTCHDQRRIINGRRSLSARLRLGVPPDVVRAKMGTYLVRGKPGGQTRLFNDNDYTIVGEYGSVYRGIVQYYKLAHNISALGKLRWVMETSMLKTLAGKHRSTVTKMARHYKAKTMTRRGLRTCFEAHLGRGTRYPLTARFGEAQLIRDKTIPVIDRKLTEPGFRHREIVQRLKYGNCELCNRRYRTVEIHQVRSLSELNNPDKDQPWHQIMRKRRRLTLVTCSGCHDLIHNHDTVCSPSR
jgi:group II intron reverse transcriptase/maturase